MNERKAEQRNTRFRIADINVDALTKTQKEALFKVAEIAAETYFKRGEELKSPDSAKQMIKNLLRAKDREYFGAIFLDTQHRVLSVEKKLFAGTIDGASVYTRIVVEKALKYKAGALLVFHNHPSGEPTPSESDIRITKQLKDTLKIVDVRLLDHFIVSHRSVTSLAELGLI